MGANAQTTVPTFTAGQVLTADQQNQSARTGVPVFADTTARDAAFGGAGEKTLAEGQLAYLENLNVVQYYDGSVWATVGPQAPGLELIKSQIIGTTVSSVAVTSAFSADYDYYKITVTGGVGSTTASMSMILGATTTGYYSGTVGATYAAATSSNANDNNAANWGLVGHYSTNTIFANIELGSPFLSKNTSIVATHGRVQTTGQSIFLAGFLNDSTSYTGFTLTPSSGTLTGGTIRVYGYKN